MTKWWLRLGALFLAALITTALVSISHSLFVQAELAALGVALPIHVRLGAIFRDFIGLLPTLGAIVLGSLLVAFLIAAALQRRAGRLAPLAYPLAGWAAIALALITMRLMFGFSPLAGARTVAGFMVMSLGGLMGGGAFAYMLRRINR